MYRKMPKFVVESDIDVRTFVRPFHDKQIVAECATVDEAYQYIKQYINDTIEVYHHFARHNICLREEVDERISSDIPVAINIVLGNFEDALYIKKV